MIRELKDHGRFYFVYLSLVIILTVVFTWPLVLNLGNSIYGYSGDSFGFIYYLWLWKDHFLRGQPLNFNPLVMAPFGTVFAPETGTVVFYWPTKLLALIFDPVVSYNLNLLISFVLAALSAYLFIYELSQSRAAAVAFSLVFAFCPYHFWKAYNHLDLAMIQYIPLFLWALVKLRKKPNWHWAGSVGLALALLALLNFYYAYFAALTFGLFLLFTLGEVLVRRQSLALLKYYLLPPLVAALVSLPFLFPVLVGSSSGDLPQARREAYHRPLDNLLLLSARPWNYFLPSTDHPVLGSLSQHAYKYLESLSQDFKTRTPFPNETTVYLGFFSIIFFLATLYLAKRGLVSRQLVTILTLTAFGLFLTSLPPFVIIKGQTIYLPSFFLYQFFPMFRSYGRLGVFFLPLISAVAALGFSYLYGKMQQKGKVVLLVLSVSFVVFEFLNFPPSRLTRVLPLPPVYAWLQEQPGDFTVMEYPKDFNLAEGEFYQMFHGKKLANWYSTYPYYQMWPYVEDIYSPQTYEILAGLGVKYAIFHKELLFGLNLVDELWPRRAFAAPISYDKLPSVLRATQNFDEADVFEVRIENPPAIAVLTSKRNNDVKIEIIGSPWESINERVLNLFNLTNAAVTVEVSDNGKQQYLDAPVGVSAVSMPAGRHDLQLKVL